MIVHVVMIKLQEDKKGEAQKLRDTLLAMSKHIDVIRHYDVGLNVKPAERNYDVVIYSKFDSLEMLDQYNGHPAHQEALVFIRSVMSQVAVVDYEE